MESTDLGSKKMNNKQDTSKEFSDEKLTKETISDTPKLKKEVETDSDGNKKIIQRARNIDTIDKKKDDGDSGNLSSDLESVSEEQTKKMIENKDRNSDITPHRYPNSNPDNKVDRGNIKLDE
jgi:hypothetical protein